MEAGLFLASSLLTKGVTLLATPFEGAPLLGLWSGPTQIASAGGVADRLEECLDTLLVTALPSLLRLDGESVNCFPWMCSTAVRFARATTSRRLVVAISTRLASLMARSLLAETSWSSFCMAKSLEKTSLAASCCCRIST